MMAARPRDSIAIVFLGVCMLHLAVLGDPCATTAEEPHKKVWGKVVRLEPNHVVIVEDPAGLEMRLHGNTTTVTRLRPGELVKALVDQDDRILFIESIEASEQAEPRADGGVNGSRTQ